MTRKARFFTSFRMTAQGHFVILRNNVTKNLSLNDREARLPLRGTKVKEKYYVFTEPVLSEAEVFRMTRKARFFTSFRMTAQGHFVILRNNVTKNLSLNDREARLPLRGMKVKEKYHVFTEPVLSEAEAFRMARKARFFTSFRMTAQGHFVILRNRVFCHSEEQRDEESLSE